MSSLWEDPGFVLIEAGLGNLFVISSNCPNGPKEILNEGKNGLLFENDKKGALEKNFYEFTKLDNEKKLIMKKNLKKNISKYSMFRHYTFLKKFLISSLLKIIYFEFKYFLSNFRYSSWFF